jgi:hypothetical protein
MAMNGVAMLLNSLGIRIDPAEIEREFNAMRTGIPAFAAQAKNTFESIDKRLASIENRLMMIESHLGVPASDDTRAAGIGGTQLAAINGLAHA